MLDMLVAFAHVASTSSSYNRPEFTDVLAAKDGRHPVLGEHQVDPPEASFTNMSLDLERYKFTDGGYVPNDTYVNEAASFQLLTGVSKDVPSRN